VPSTTRTRRAAEVTGAATATAGTAAMAAAGGIAGTVETAAADGAAFRPRRLPAAFERDFLRKTFMESVKPALGASAPALRCRPKCAGR